MRLTPSAARLALGTVVLLTATLSLNVEQLPTPVAHAVDVEDSDCVLTPGQIEKGVKCKKDDLNSFRNAPVSGVTNLGIGTISNFLLGLVGGLAVLYLVYGGIRYMTAGDDLERLAGAKRTMLYSVIGLVVTLLAYVIVTQVLTTLYSAE